MIRKNYNKLVRDKIIEIIESDNGKPVFKTLNEDDFKKACKEKLIEEANELFNADSKEDLINELSDIMEIIKYIKLSNLISDDELDNKIIEKRNKRGGFDQKIFLEYSDENK